MKVVRLYIVSNAQSNLMAAISDPSCRQADIASFYEDAIIADKSREEGAEGVDWALVNKAIIARWPKGLQRIKTMAWKRLGDTR